MSLTFLLGGARSGKSSLAVRLAAETRRQVVFVATAEARDSELADRIARHRAERPAGWQTVEEPLALGSALEAAPVDACVVVDCLSLWVANLLERDGQDVEEQAAAAAAIAAARSGPTIAVSNEVGLGVVPATLLGRTYRDLLGRVNASWAEAATDSFLIVAGKALRLEDV